MARLPTRTSRKVSAANVKVKRRQSGGDETDRVEGTEGQDMSPQHVEPIEGSKESSRSKKKYVQPTFPDGRPRVDLDKFRRRIDREVQQQGIFMHGVHDDWFWMDNCHLRRRTATLGEIAPRAPGDDDDEMVFFMDL